MIAIYIVCGIGIGFSLGMMAAAVLVDRRAKKRRKELAQLVGRRGMGKTAHLGNITPFCYLDQEEEEEEQFEMLEMQEGPDEPDEYMEQCYEYELKCKEEGKK